MKILVCGGHLTPALAVIDFIQAAHPQDKLMFVGTGWTQKTNRQISQEEQEVTQRGVPFAKMSAVKLTELKSLWFPIEFIKLIGSVFQAAKIICRYRPQVILAFGGYVAIPVTITAWLLRIPVVTHEQTRATGLANQIIARFARKVAISHGESSKFFPHHKVVLTGNPIRSQLFTTRATKPQWLTSPLSESYPLLYITGGNQGSQILNDTISQILPQLTTKWTVIHQCGNPTATSDYQKNLLALRNQLPSSKQQRYFVQPWVDTTELAWIYRHAAGVISRAGANTVDELAHFHLPSILIPLPFAHHQEQLLNAQALAKKRVAVIIPQRKLNPEVLLKKTTWLRNQFDQIRKKFPQEETSQDLAAEKIYEVLQKVTTS